MKSKVKPLLAWAVINTNWEEDEWPNPFYQNILGIRGMDVYAYTIFETKKEARAFQGKEDKSFGIRYGDKIIKVKIIPV